jgi:hypothetical protein
VGRLSFWSVNRDTACGSVAAKKFAGADASSTCRGVSQNRPAFTDAFNR